MDRFAEKAIVLWQEVLSVAQFSWRPHGIVLDQIV